MIHTDGIPTIAMSESDQLESNRDPGDETQHCCGDLPERCIYACPEKSE